MGIRDRGGKKLSSAPGVRYPRFVEQLSAQVREVLVFMPPARQP
jgi:hypothetical protein